MPAQHFRPSSPPPASARVLAGLMLLVATALHAGSPPPDEVPTSAELRPGAGAEALSRQVEALFAKAEQQGSVRVIVGLDAGFQPEGGLPDEAAKSQRWSIELLQDRVVTHLAALDSRLIARYRYIPFLALAVDAEALAALTALPEVRRIEEDRLSRPTMASSNPVIGAPDAWAAGYSGAGQTVAVLDTGVDKSHPFFTTGGRKVVSEACYSTNDVSVTSFCPGGASSSTAPGSGRNCPVALYGCDHGTHVAGTVAGNDGSGPDFGVARDADLIAMQVFSRIDDWDACGGDPPCVLTFTSDYVQALERVFELRNTFDIAAVNMSLGGDRYLDAAACDADNPATKAAIDNLRSVGIATVIASGNAGYLDSMGAPGCISTAVSVGATTDGDAVADFSNVTSFIDLLAPGVSIDSSVPGGGLDNFDGTSMATPHVAGAWAILKQAAPSLSVDDALAALRSTGTRVHDSRPGGTVRNMRRINIDQAVGQVATSTCAADGFESDDSWAQANRINSGSPQSHSICPAGDEDWAFFDLSGESEVVLGTSGAAGDTRMSLFDANRNLIEFNDDGATDYFSSIDRVCGVDPLPAGRYFVQVDEYADDGADEIEAYNLSFVANSCQGGSGCTDDLDNGVVCLADNRFEFTMTWTDRQGVTRPVFFDKYTSRSALVFFFSGKRDIVLIVKAIPACSSTNHFIIWQGGASGGGAAWNLMVRDTQTGQTQPYSKALGQFENAAKDDSTFPCP